MAIENDDGNLYSVEAPKPKIHAPLHEILATTLGGSAEDWAFTARRMQTEIGKVLAEEARLVLVHPEPNEAGLHEIKMYERFARDGSAIVRMAYATPEQFATGSFEIPEHGIYAVDIPDAGQAPGNVRYLGE